MSYRIKSAAMLTGIPTATLRAWERRHGIVNPRRTEGGYRVYSDEDLARLLRVKALVDRGYKVGEAVSLLDGDRPEVPPLTVPPDYVVTMRNELLEALLDMDRVRADRIGGQLELLSFHARVDEVLLPLLAAVGGYWASGRASVAQEHFASVFAREKLVGMLEKLGSGPVGAREVVCAGAPGELHELGLLAAAIHLALGGWRVVYLGADVPIVDLEPVLRSRVPTFVCSSILTPRSAAEVTELALQLRSAAPPETVVVLGGAGIPLELLGTPEPGLHLVSRIAELLELQHGGGINNGR